MTKILAYLSVLFMLIGQLSLWLEFLYYIEGLRQFTFASSAIGRIIGMGLLFSQGTLRKKSPLNWVFVLFFVVAITGILTRVLHWNGSLQLLLTGAAGIMGIYLLHFVQKSEKHLTDILKLAWVLIFCTSNLYILQQMPYHVELLPYKWIESALFLVLLIILIANEHEKGKTAADHQTEAKDNPG